MVRSRTLKLARPHGQSADQFQQLGHVQRGQLARGAVQRDGARTGQVAHQLGRGAFDRSACLDDGVRQVEVQDVDQFHLHLGQVDGCFFHHFQPWCSSASADSTNAARRKREPLVTQAGLIMLFR